MADTKAVRIEADVLGSHRISIMGDDEKDAIKRISLFSQLPHACPECGASLSFSYRKVAAKEGKKGGTFYGVRCMGIPPHEKYFHVHDNEEQSLYWIEKEQFQVAFQYREGSQNNGGSGGYGDEYYEPHEHGEQESRPIAETPAGAPPPLTTAQPGAQKKEEAGSAPASVASEEQQRMQKRGRAMAAMSMVTQKPEGYVIQTKPDEAFMVTPSRDNPRQAECSDCLVYPCEHIFAVREFVKMEREKAQAAKTP